LQAAVVVAGAAAVGAVATLGKFETVEERNWEAFHQRIRALVRRGHDVESFVLYAERPQHLGFRFAVVEVANQPPLSWFQPWSRCV
jgi:hypothetical protein